MAQLWASGPIDVHLRFGTAPSVFLGHGSSPPTIADSPVYTNVPCDVSGGTVPIDRIFTGETSSVTIELVRFNHNVVDRLLSRSSGTNVSGTKGTYAPGEIGSLMLLEGCAFELYLVSTFALKPQFLNSLSGPMEPARRYLAATTDDDHIQLGSNTAKKVRIQFFCFPVLSIDQSGSPYGSYRLKLYDTDLTGLSSTPD